MSFLNLRFRYFLIILVALAVIAIPLASISQTPENNLVYLSDKTAVLLPLDFANAVEDIALSDIDGNGYADIVYVTSSAGNLYSIKTLLNTGGLFVQTTGYSINAITGTPVAFALGDINRDNQPDILLSSGSAFRLFLNDPAQKAFVENSASALVNVLNTLKVIPRLLKLADINGDGNIDIWVAGELNDAPVNILLIYDAGRNSYTRQELPQELQSAIVTDIRFADINYDSLAV